MRLCWRVRRLPRADAGGNPVAAALLDDLSDARLRRCGYWRLASGAFTLAVDSCFQPDGVNRYHAAPQVVYLDPMFPHRQKSALVKKRDAGVSVAGGADLDADDRWPARQLAHQTRGGQTP